MFEVLYQTGAQMGIRSCLYVRRRLACDPFGKIVCHRQVDDATGHVCQAGSLYSLLNEESR
jgi:hypothetical protein